MQNLLKSKINTICNVSKDILHTKSIKNIINLSLTKFLPCMKNIIFN